ncbi:MotE family protein [Kordiimonas lacus]|uniref:Flagellar motility protein MotE, a chaperone for MotC folding n=1 Tax=Kordiimonas lacus TaxID=637679 RepID=A0A1G6VZY1_9PROT|nr:hypothetical protein [Kordiimonas lacus]SDD59118.1 Flagellar motility protein MotE, a chaperone for MotC folding [Kordiimonas lacus]
MSGAIYSRVRLFPLLILFALAALGLRGVSLYAGYDLMVAVAQDENQAQEDTAQAEGDNAGADDPATTTAAAAPPPIIGLPSTQEMELITQLRQRRQDLEAREQQLDLQEQLLASTEKRINDKIVQLQELEVQIKKHLRLFEEVEEKQLDAIVEVYEKMKPKDAAPRFEALALQTQVDLVTRMKPAKVAALMENMSPQKASILTTELATQVQPPNFDEVRGGGR